MTQDQNLHVLSHPVIADRLGKMRDKSTSCEEFRLHMKQVAKILAMEATKTLPTHTKTIETPLEQTSVAVLNDTSPLIVPILRAGLGISQGFEDILPEADIGHIGLYRDEDTHRPVSYLVRLPPNMKRPVFITDPMLATGHSLLKAIEILIEHGAELNQISVVTLLCAPEGIAEVRSSYPNLPIYTADIDRHLNENAFIVPGLGDAGDRTFGTV